MQNSDLKKRTLFTIFIILLYRTGTFIPIPGVNSYVVQNFFTGKNFSMFGMINLFSGGALERMSIFALNIMPYITASIVMQLITSMHKGLESLKKEGDFGRNKIAQYTRYFTIFLAFFQSIGIYYALISSESILPTSDSGILIWTTCITLVSGAVLLMWLGERITNSGIGNGISLIIFVGIVSSIPSSFFQFLDLFKSGVYSLIFIFIFFLCFILLLSLVVFVEKSYRKIKIQYPNVTMMRINGIKDFSFLPLKINISGVIPPIFASSILMFPSAMIQLFGNNMEASPNILSRGSWFYMPMFAALILFFSFFYSSVVFNTKDVADNLKKSNCFILGIRPGSNTSIYLDKIIARLAFLGAVYLIFVCTVPEILIVNYSIPIHIGGTGILIVVNVVLDLISQIQSSLVPKNYSGSNFYKRKIKLRI